MYAIKSKLFSWNDVPEEYINEKKRRDNQNSKQCLLVFTTSLNEKQLRQQATDTERRCSDMCLGHGSITTTSTITRNMAFDEDDVNVEMGANGSSRAVAPTREREKAFLLRESGVIRWR